jgi:hypothetical protein
MLLGGKRQKKNIQKQIGLEVNIPGSWIHWEGNGRGRRTIFRKSGRGGKYSGQLAILGKVTGRDRRRIFRKSGMGGKCSGQLAILSKVTGRY